MQSKEAKQGKREKGSDATEEKIQRSKIAKAEKQRAAPRLAPSPISLPASQHSRGMDGLD